MNIKLNLKCRPTGIPSAVVACSPMVLDNGMPQVYAAITIAETLDASMIGSLRLSSSEARDLAARLVASADTADAMALNEVR